VWSATTGAVALTLAAVAYTASVRGRTARSNELAGRAISMVRSDPEVATLLSLEALNQSATRAAVSALRVALAQLPDIQVPVAPGADIGSPRAVSFTRDGRRMAVAEGRTPPRIIDMTSRAVLELTDAGATPVEDLRWSQDGAFIAVTSENSTLVLNATTGKLVARTDGQLFWRATAAATGLPAAIVNEGTIRLVELQQAGSWKTLNQLRTQRGELSPDGSKVATLDEDTRRLTVTDLESGQTARRTLSGPTRGGLFWSPQGNYLVAHDLFGFVVVDARSLATVFTIDAGNEIIVEDLSVSADDTRLAGSDRQGSTTVWDIRRKEKVAELVGQDARAYRPVFTSDGTLLSVLYSNGRADVFDLSNSEGRPLTTFDATAGDIVSTAFTPDSRWLVLQDETGPGALWSTDRWRLEHRLPLGYGGWRVLQNVRVTPDGSAVVVQNGAAVQTWNTLSGKEQTAVDRSVSLQPLPLGAAKASQLYRLSHEADVQSEPLSEDGACILPASAYRMASGGAPANANVVRLWDAESATLLRQWQFPVFGPDAAFFAGRDRIVALHEGKGYVYRTRLCE